MAGRWSLFDHTGDLGLLVFADSPAELYEAAAVALSAQIAVASDPRVDLSCRLALDGDDPADLLVHWLNSSLLEADKRRAVWTRARVANLGPTALEADLDGQRLERGRQEFQREIKAVSHHGLELDLETRPCRCRLILDL